MKQAKQGRASVWSAHASDHPTALGFGCPSALSLLLLSSPFAAGAFWVHGP